jgi:hypothetical protein
MVSPMRSQRMLKRAQALGELRIPATDMPDDLLNTSDGGEATVQAIFDLGDQCIYGLQVHFEFLRGLWRAWSPAAQAERSGILAGFRG